MHFGIIPFAKLFENLSVRAALCHTPNIEPYWKYMWRTYVEIYIEIEIGKKELLCISIGNDLS